MDINFPINFLQLNINTNFFNHCEGAGFKIIRLGFKMILCFLRSGFYTFKHIGGLLAFVRQKIRFLKTWKGDQDWEDEGQWFMIKFVKHCLYIIADHVYEILIQNPKKLQGFGLREAHKEAAE